MSNTELNSKNEVVLVEKMSERPAGQNSKQDVEVQSRFSPQEEARIRRRVSYRVVPILGLMLGIALMDRSNVANAGERIPLQCACQHRFVKCYSFRIS
jgi:hypothetical protein